MSKYLRAVYTTNRGSKRTLSFQNPVPNLTAETAETVLTTMVNAGCFEITNSQGLTEDLDNLVDLYYEETVITQLTD